MSLPSEQLQVCGRGGGGSETPGVFPGARSPTDGRYFWVSSLLAGCMWKPKEAHHGGGHFLISEASSISARGKRQLGSRKLRRRCRIGWRRRGLAWAPFALGSCRLRGRQTSPGPISEYIFHFRPSLRVLSASPRTSHPGLFLEPGRKFLRARTRPRSGTFRPSCAGEAARGAAGQAGAGTDVVREQVGAEKRVTAPRMCSNPAEQ